MLQNNNLKICRKLVRQELQFHKGQCLLLVTAVTLVCMLYTFSFAMGSHVYDGFLYSYRLMYGSGSHIICYDLSTEQAALLESHNAVKDTVLLSPIGTLSDEMLGNRNVKLAEFSEKWARETDSVPLYGQAPAEEDEIALDEITLNSLLIPHEIGAEVFLTWVPEGGGEERAGVFRLCGWWKNNTGETDSCAWITKEAAEELGGGTPEHKTLGLTLYLPGDPERQAKDLFSDTGIQNITYTTNLAGNRARMAYAGGKAMEFYRLNLIVVLCGILMLYTILRLSDRRNIQFYAGVKALGMTPRQIRVLAVYRAAALCLPGLLPGWILGFSLCALLAPYVVVGLGANPALFFFRLWPFGLGALLTWLTVLTACLLPIRSVAKYTPAEAMRFTGGNTKIKTMRSMAGRSKTKNRGLRRTTIRRMAFTELSRHKGQSLLAALSLLLSLIILCCVWTKGVSYDEEKYLEGAALCDYRLSDPSAAADTQRYNPKSRSIAPEIPETLSGHPAVENIGIVCTMEVPMYAGAQERAPIIETFEETDERGVIRKEYMADVPDWIAGYEKMRESGEYIGIVTGVDKLALEKAVTQNIFIEGAFSEEDFDTGKYVIASGAASLLKTTPPAGTKVMICGREFEIMACVLFESSLASGADSRQAQFNVTYYVPIGVFEELFPEHGIRNVLIDIDRSRQDEFEAFLADTLRGTEIHITSVRDHQLNFRNALFHICMIPLFVGGVMLVIGMLNFTNVLMMGILVRKRDFAVYESLGMTKRQLGKLLLWEGLSCFGIMTGLLVPGVAAAVWLWGKWQLAHMNTWCVTWRFSLLPLWISLPVLLIIVLAVPLYFMKFVTKESVTERLRSAE